MPDTELENYVKKIISEQTTQTTNTKDLVNDGHEHNFQLEDLVKHQASCTCPDCPYCKSMRERIETVKDDNLIENTIKRAEKVIESKLSEKKEINYDDYVKIIKYLDDNYSLSNKTSKMIDSILWKITVK